MNYSFTSRKWFLIHITCHELTLIAKQLDFYLEFDATLGAEATKTNGMIPAPRNCTLVTETQVVLYWYGSENERGYETFPGQRYTLNWAVKVNSTITEFTFSFGLSSLFISLLSDLG